MEVENKYHNTNILSHICPKKNISYVSEKSYEFNLLIDNQIDHTSSHNINTYIDLKKKMQHQSRRNQSC